MVCATGVAMTAAQLKSSSRTDRPARPSGKIVPLSPFPSRTHFTLALNNQLIAGPAYDEGHGYFSIEGDRIVAYDLTSGMQRWVVSAKPRRAPVVGGDLLFIDQEGSLSALRTSDGSTAWTVPFAETLVTTPAWDRAWLVVVTATDVLAFRAADGTQVWRQAIAGTRAAPAIDADRVYLSLADGRVLALRLDTGAEIWARKLGGPPNEILALDDRLFLGSNDNYFYGLKADDGMVDWRVRTGADVVSKPIADRDRLYFVSLDNVIRAVNRRNGVQQWKKPLPFRPAWPPLAAADAVVVAGISGAVQAFFMKDGMLAGELPVDAASEIAAPPHAFRSTAALGPIVIVVTRSIAGGAIIMAVSHTIDPPMVPLAPLPGLIPVGVPKTQ
jgi:outer membrane protein assembly factor BamB